MKKINNVRGDFEQAKPLIVGKDTVYIHSNIQEHIDDKDFVYYTYDEIQYDKDEYLLKIFNENEMIKEVLDNLIMGGNNGKISSNEN